MDDAMRARLELRRSNAARPHRNRKREARTGRQPVHTCYCGSADCNECADWDQP